jgi:hypothetical protein
VPGLGALARGVLLAATLGLAAPACGARTGLDAPDVTVPRDAHVPFDGCQRGAIPLVRPRPQVLLVIDRSGSMEDDLEGHLSAGLRPTRWQLLRDGLAQTLPPFDTAIDLGAMVFPRIGADGPGAASCEIATAVDLQPARGNTAAVLALLGASGPSGATPTYAALSLAAAYLAAHRDPDGAAYLVLATDGAPNCNAALDAATCVCTNRDDVSGQPQCATEADGAYDCLDDVRSLAAVTDARAHGVVTYVVGFRDLTFPETSTLLDSLATAGGRANADGATRYYNVAQPDDLPRAFRGIAQSVARCTFRGAAGAAAAGEDLVLVVDGGIVPRDASHRGGWDITDPAAGEITLYGADCDALTDQSVVRAYVGCADR